MFRPVLLVAIMALASCSTRGPLNDPETYVLRVIAENGCEMSYDEFDARLTADGYVADWPRNSPPDEQTRQRIEEREAIYIAAATLIADSVLEVDPNDRNRVRSRGRGC